jgi:hypothetical protein
MLKTPLPANTSFLVTAYDNKVTSSSGPSTVTEDDVSFWNPANVAVNKRQTVVGTLDVLYRYALSNLDTIAPVGAATLFHVEQGKTRVTVNGTPDAEDIRLYVGNGKARDHIALTNAVGYLKDAFLEASAGN